MSLTKAQTAAVDTLLDYLAETARPGHTSPPKHAEAHNALVLLAVAAGHDGNDADARLAATWRDRLNVQRDLAEVDRLTTALADARDGTFYADLNRELADPGVRADFEANAEMIQRIDTATRDRDQARARVAELEDKTRAIRSHIRVHQHILADRQRENPQSATIAAKLQTLDQIAACLDHMHDEPQPAAPDRSDGNGQ